ncbi:hypothetical protein M9Y10_024341 [Tritrichomonas musculus]|uniref:Protein kinase domain-containing protein n=1 Tax=Tritrichomonas musculus TaxID=1915356 RepID=A0ABR2HCQ6_9EUKA
MEYFSQKWSNEEEEEGKIEEEEDLELEKVEDFQFDEIPQNIKKMQNEIQDKNLRRIYDKIEFLYFNYLEHSNQKTDDKITNFKKLISYYIQQYKFFTYYFDPSDENDNNIVNSIICVEQKCIIIESIRKDIISDTISSIESTFINSGSQKINNSNDSIQEVESFCQYFIRHIRTNKFVNMTIRPISCYLIRRFYFPSHFFKDPSFFEFKRQNASVDQLVINSFIDMINECTNQDFNKDFFYLNFTIFFSKLDEILKHEKEIKKPREINFFSEEEFIELRQINHMISLVMHIDSLYIFVRKYIDYHEFTDNKANHEIQFCLDHSHECFVKCHGFIKVNGKVQMILYDFMSNGSLYQISDKLNELYSFTIMSRVFKGIDYLHSNLLVHRDIKPDNILIDHDYKPFISDFETIRKISPLEDKKMTYEFGSCGYASPEQILGEDISYSTDIFSFGLVVYFLFEKDDLFHTNDIDSIIQQIQNNDLPLITNASHYIQDLFEKCIKIEPEKRLKSSKIKKIIYRQICMLEFLSRFLTNERIRAKEILELRQYFIEVILFLYESNKTNFISSYVEKLYNFLNTRFSSRKTNAIFNLNNYEFKSKGITNEYFRKTDVFTLLIKKNKPGALIAGGCFYFEGKYIKPNYTRSKKYFELAIEQEAWDAYYNLGRMYYEGKGVIKDMKKAVEYFELGASKNDSNCLFILANIYIEGNGVEKNIEKALKYYELAAQQDCSFALNSLGVIYLKGEKVEQDTDKGIKYLKLSAELGDKMALFNIGFLYYIGKGLKKDYQKAIEYFELASNEGNSDALYFLGMIYYDGIEVNQDYKKGLKYIERSVKLNNSDAICFMGNIYYEGKAVKQNFQKAKEYYELSANMNNSYGLLSLGNLYYIGKVVNRDFSQAKELYELSAKQNNSNAYLYLGIIYYEGLFVVKDYLRAIEYTKLSAELNNSDAFCILGFIYLQGLNVKQDLDLAKEYFELSAKNMNSLAFYIFGMLYYEGKYVTKDYFKAKKYFKISAFKGDSNAIFKLGILYYKGEGVSKNYLEAIKYFNLSAQLKNSEGLYYCGYAFENGKGVNINISKAIKYYKQCINNIRNNETLSDPLDMFISTMIKTNDYIYVCYNSLGLIYIYDFELENHKKAFKYLKESGMNEFSFGQNNLGLFYQFYLNDINNSKYMYERSSKQNFALAEYNIGYLFECDKKEDEAIEHFILASKYSKEPLSFRNISIIDDDRFIISKTFIICLTNLKLSLYFLSKLSFEESREYLMKTLIDPLIELLMRLDKSSFQFQIRPNENNLLNIILCSPLFNLYDYDNSGWLKFNSNPNEEKIIIQLLPHEKDENKELFYQNKFEQVKNNYCDKDMYDFETECEEVEKLEFKTRYVQFPKRLDKIIFNQLCDAESSLKEVISNMTKILYTKPYSILFGRIKSNKSLINLAKINSLFYEGFDIDI